MFNVVDEEDMVIITRKACYIVDMDRPVTAEEETAIEEILCNSELGQYRADSGTLFTFIVDDEPFSYDQLS